MRTVAPVVDRLAAGDEASACDAAHPRRHRRALVHAAHLYYFPPVPVVLVLAFSVWLWRSVKTRIPCASIYSHARLYFSGVQRVVGISIWPNIIPPDISAVCRRRAAAKSCFMLVGALIIIPIILAYTFWSHMSSVESATWRGGIILMVKVKNGRGESYGWSRYGAPACFCWRASECYSDCSCTPQISLLTDTRRFHLSRASAFLSTDIGVFISDHLARPFFPSIAADNYSHLIVVPAADMVRYTVANALV